jgi:hypothetical protein
MYIFINYYQTSSNTSKVSYMKHIRVHIVSLSLYQTVFVFSLFNVDSKIKQRRVSQLLKKEYSASKLHKGLSM